MKKVLSLLAAALVLCVLFLGCTNPDESSEASSSMQSEHVETVESRTVPSGSDSDATTGSETMSETTEPTVETLAVEDTYSVTLGESEGFGGN